jgi:hypothetical protein
MVSVMCLSGNLSRIGADMAKEKTQAAKLTPDLLPKRGRGRPLKASSLTGAQRIAKMRSERKEAGLCVCCGQPLLGKPA